MTAKSPPIAISYIRWSSGSQTLGDSERRQLERSREYAAARGWQLLDEITDSGISAFRGRNVADGGLGTFLAAVRAKKIKVDYLLVESFDRISRQDPFTSFGIFSEIIRAGIGIVTLADGHVYGNGNEKELGSLIMSLVSMSRAHEESA